MRRSRVEVPLAGSQLIGSHWRTSAWSGAAIGIVAAVVLTWLVLEGVQAFLSAMQRGATTLAGPGWLLLAVGAVLVVVVVGADFHPLIPAVPAVWFLLLFGPLLVGVGALPDWYPEWMTSYFLKTGSAAVYIVTGVLVAGTIAALVRRRLVSSEHAAVEDEEARL